LIELLRAHLDSHGHEHVFTGRDGGLHRRSSFHRRHWQPAVEGDPDNDIPAIVRGLHFHDLRHSIYSHVSATIEQRLVAGLQTRWEQNCSPPRR
jgi:integrase